MSLEKSPIKANELPEIFLGGMGVAVSDWRLAKAVAEVGGLGIVSGTAIGLVLARRLQDGDLDGSMRRGLSMFPDDEIAAEILHEYYLPGGRGDYQPYKRVPRFTDEPSPLAEKLNIAGAYVETKLAKEHGDKGMIGMNLLTKIQPQTPSAIYGAMLAGLDVLTMGAGVAINVPKTLELLTEGKAVDYRIYVDGETTEHYTHFDPNKYEKLSRIKLNKPLFFHIISSNILAIKLASYDHRPDGYIVERHIAGGHNASARGKKADEMGQPIYGPKDEVDLIKLAELELPFWLAGGFGGPDGLGQGAMGIQVGSAFELCEESGINRDIKYKMLNRVLGGRALDIFTDPLASPSGYPFKVVGLEGSLSEEEIFLNRQRICDLGILADPYEMPDKDNQLGWRCPAEPEESYLRKGGELSKTLGRKCICNGLSATAGGAQIRISKNGIYTEPPIITAGNDINRVIQEITASTGPGFTAADVMDYLKSER